MSIRRLGTDLVQDGGRSTRRRRLAVALVVGAVLVPVPSSLGVPAAAAPKAVKYKVTAKSSTAHADTGRTIRVRGKVTPKPSANASKRSKRIHLQKRRDGRWITIATKRVGAKGKYRFTVKTGRQAALIQLRVRKPATNPQRRAASGVRRVHVYNCSNPEQTGDFIGKRFLRKFKGHPFWYEAPNFDKVARPVMRGLRSTCGFERAYEVVGHMNVVGVTWRALTSWLDE